MTRRQRQVDELRALCRSGDVARAVDLAFEHFACFGADEHVVHLLRAAVARASVTQEVRTRYAELLDGSDGAPDVRAAPCEPA